MVLTPKSTLTENEMIWYSLCIRANKWKFSYSRKITPKRLGNTEIPDTIPAWVNKVVIPDIKQYEKPLNGKMTEPLDTSTWKEFKYTDLFKIERGTIQSMSNIKAGDTPIITASTHNNGVGGFFNIKPAYQGNIITVSAIGVCGQAFYQENPCSVSVNVNVAIPKFDLNKYRALFLCTLIRLEKPRYNYGYNLSQERMRNSTIKLPVDINGDPNWQWMEEYIKSLPFSSSI